jgi:hypothetical protein
MTMTQLEIEEILLGLKAAVRRMQERGMKVDGTGSSAYFPLPIGLGLNGGIYQGTGTFATPTTGLKIWNDAGIGRIGGYNAGVVQWYANTDGKLYAAAGGLVIDTKGISLEIAGLADADVNSQNYIRFNVSGTRMGQLYAADNATDFRVGVSAHKEGIKNIAFLTAVSEATYIGKTYIEAVSGTLHEQITVQADSDGDSAIIIGDQGHFGTRIGNAAVYPSANNLYVTQEIASAAGTGVETYKMLDGTTTKSSLKWVGDTITWDIPSVEPANKITNGSFDTDLSGWMDHEDWWLAGGISAANAIGAYQAQGAANLAASYVNLANPGTYDAAPGVAPTWDAVNGWKFLASSSQCLTTGITPSPLALWTVICKFSDAITVNAALFGQLGATAHTYILPLYGGNSCQYLNGSPASGLIITGALTSGVLAIAGTKAYHDGSAEAGTISNGSGTTYPILIGGIQRVATRTNYITAYEQAVAIYDTPITAEQVLAVTNAMNALVSTRDTTTKYSGAASAKVVAGLDRTFLFSANVGDTSTYTLTCYAYTTGAAVVTADLDLWYDGAELTTTFADMGSGWYKLTGTLTGVASAKDYGVRVHAGKTAYVDSFTLQVGAGSTTTLSILNSGTGIVHQNVEGTTTLNAGIATEQALIVKGFAGQTANLAEFQQSDGTIKVSIDENGITTIGASAVAASANDGLLQVTGVAGQAYPAISAYNDTAGGGIVSYNSLAEGTTSGGRLKAGALFIPSATGKLIGSVRFGAYRTGTTFTDGATIEAHSAEAWSNTAVGSYIKFMVATNASTTRAEGLRLGDGAKIGFFGATPVIKQAHIPNPTGGAVVDTEARAAIVLLTALMETYGFTALS